MPLMSLLLLILCVRGSMELTSHSTVAAPVTPAMAAKPSNAEAMLPPSSVIPEGANISQATYTTESRSNAARTLSATPSPSPSVSTLPPALPSTSTRGGKEPNSADWYGMPHNSKPPHGSSGATQALMGILLMLLAGLIAYAYKLYKQTRPQYERFASENL
ncbi:hypothetical protein KP509_10G051900 [Ceratopteris richardii]|uniref:Uncharacterized protein n=1 Tax=Ceratopteris richardii TaxID=49495 RepID=A0A8T2TVW6_CERRI|nr:hypothetical protein KP509_10G051900 [Ceratopteris richardii]